MTLLINLTEGYNPFGHTGLLNGCGFRKVLTLDPHSDVTAAGISRPNRRERIET